MRQLRTGCQGVVVLQSCAVSSLRQSHLKNQVISKLAATIAAVNEMDMPRTAALKPQVLLLVMIPRPYFCPERQTCWQPDQRGPVPGCKP